MRDLRGVKRADSDARDMKRANSESRGVKRALANFDPGVSVPRINVSELGERYDAILFDAYGVLVHSAGAMPGARDTIATFNRTGMPYAIITNDASKQPEAAAKRYRGFGLDISPERILSSGLLLRRYFERHGLRD